MNKIKTLFTVIFGTLSSLLGVLAIPVFLLVTCNVIDYVTGIMACSYRKQEISSYKGIRGITKKICMWLLIVVGVIIDHLILYASTQVGLVIPFSFAVGCIVAMWLICNELISILENIKDIGVPLPSFLEKLVKNVKTQIETKVDKEE